MSICLIGKNLTNYVLASAFSKHGLNVDILYESKKNIIKSTRTLALTEENFHFLKSILNNFNIYKWPIKKIEIYNDKNNENNFIQFEKEPENSFYMVYYYDILKLFEKNCKTSKKIKFIYKKSIYNYLKNIKYKIIINSDPNGSISKKFFYRKIHKNYFSTAYTGILYHLKKENYKACQIFTKYGPIAFLPIGKKKTSIVFSLLNKYKLNKKEIYSKIITYNKNYDIKYLGKLEKFTLKLTLSRNYLFQNILSFGDSIHKVHPLAGQGFNMTLRDTQELLKLFKRNIELGLDLNESLLNDFIKKVKHKNYIFGMTIDSINTFFNLDVKVNNQLSNKLISFLKKNKNILKLINNIADKGI